MKRRPVLCGQSYLASLGARADVVIGNILAQPPRLSGAIGEGNVTIGPDQIEASARKAGHGHLREPMEMMEWQPELHAFG
jgi:hypothetical protein